MDAIATISQLIERQFPAIYREEGPELVTFVKAYYEFLEQGNNAIQVVRQLPGNLDIDTTLDDFVSHFKATYLADFPFIAATDKRFLIKHVLDLYRSKGSEKSLRLLFRMLFNEDIDLYLPGKDILKPSASKWVKPNYIEVTHSARSVAMVNKQIVGSRTGATAFVEGVVTKRASGKLIDLIYISSVRGTFQRGEVVTDDGQLTDAPLVIGSLTDVIITNGGANSAVGDLYNVVADIGVKGSVRVTAVEDATGRVNFDIVDGGSGYTTDANTVVYVSDAVLTVNNAPEIFQRWETVQQRVETISVLSATDLLAGVTAGDYIVGVASGNSVANGVVVSASNTNANGVVIAAASANGIIKLIATEGTFGNQLQLDLEDPTAFATDEVLYEQSTTQITYSSIISGPFSNGEVVEMLETVAVGNTTYTTGRSFGTITSVNATAMTLEPAWGDFTAGETITGLTSGASATIATSSNTVAGAYGTVATMSDANSVVLSAITGTFNVGNLVYGSKTKLTANVTAVANTGASDLWLSGNSSSNGVVDTVANTWAVATVIGQNTTAVGVYGNAYPFYASDSLSFPIVDDRNNALSPPLYANGDVISFEVDILAVSTGTDAGFSVGSLTSEETVSINVDRITGTNINGIPYRDIGIDGSNSGVGFVDSVTVIDGGTLYSNGQVISFAGGGYANGNPFVAANATITTNGSGTITSVTVVTAGEGYYGPAIATLPATGGAVANVVVVMDYGYGFPADPDGDANTVVATCLTNDSMTIGTIASLASINPGSNYNADPFVAVYNPVVAGYGRGNYVLEFDTLSGSFRSGELVTQTVANTVYGKGIVLAANTTALVVKRTSFNAAFSANVNVEGSSSGASANVTNTYQLGSESSYDRNIMGDNADITSDVIAANGVVTAIQVIDSGYGYEDGATVTLRSSNNNFVITGTANVINHGTATGYWANRISHLDESGVIQDSHYYQEYSYDIRSSQSLDKYRNVVKSVLHVAGTKMFGSVVKQSTKAVSITLGGANSSITVS